MDISMLLKQFAEAISPALQQLVVALVIAVLTAVTAWIKKKYDGLVLNQSIDKRYLIETAVIIGVDGAKQIYGESKERNAEKLSYAFKTADQILRGYGFVIDSAVIYAQIEAAIFQAKP
jgi:hypothetical protein